MKQHSQPFAKREARILAREVRVTHFWDRVDTLFGSALTRYLFPVLGAILLVLLLHGPLVSLWPGQPSSFRMDGSQAIILYISLIAIYILLRLLVWGLGSLAELVASARYGAVCYQHWADRALTARTNDADIYRQIADTSAMTDTRKRAAEAIRDKAALRALALEGVQNDARCKAAFLLGEQAVYCAMIDTLTDSPERDSVAAAITDQPTLGRLAAADPQSVVRASAVSRLDDRAAVARVALNDASLNVRDKAVSRLISSLQALDKAEAAPPWAAVARRTLNHIALADCEPYVRLQALKAVTDQRVLGRVALRDVQDHIRLQAVKALNDQDTLAQVAFTEPDVAIRSDAIRKINDQQTLFQIAAEDKDPCVCLAAVRNMTDDTLLRRLLPQAEHGKALLEAIVARLSETPSLLPIAMGEHDEALCLIAVDRLNDQPALADVALHAAHEPCRAQAASRLRDTGALAAALVSDSAPAVRKAAADRLAQLDAQAAVPQLCAALRDEHVKVRLSAAAALKTAYLAGKCRAEIAAQSGLQLRPHADHSDTVHDDSSYDEMVDDCYNHICNGQIHSDSHTDETGTTHTDEAEILFDC